MDKTTEKENIEFNVEDVSVWEYDEDEIEYPRYGYISPDENLDDLGY